MKVMCIDASNPETAAACKDEYMIYEGDVYTVTEVKNVNGSDYFGLLERGNNGVACLYRATRFIPLSEIDENIIHRQFQKINAS